MPVASAPRRRRVVVALVACLVACLTTVLAGTPTVAATAALPLPPPTASVPTTIVIDSITSRARPPAGVPPGSAPYLIVRAGGAIAVRVSFYDADGNRAAFSETTSLAVASSAGTTDPATFTVAKKRTSATLTTSIPTPATQVALTVAVVGSTTVTPGTSSAAQLFDVLTDFKFVGARPRTALKAGIGGRRSCADATPAAPVCGVVVLPNGAISSQVLLSIGSCDLTYGGCGSIAGSIVQMLGDLTGLYTRTAPAALVLRCDRTYCGTGSIQGIELNFSLAGDGPLGPAPACPGRGTVGETQDACVDYAQSHRVAGDSLLYLLFTRDIRGSVS